tara:strand:- start:368 stop:559 length:192 start_codon:yes stop_codon:yes gene_type:complete
MAIIENTILKHNKKQKDFNNEYKSKIMETPKEQLIELYYQRIQAMTQKINELQKQLNYEKRKN